MNTPAIRVGRHHITFPGATSRLFDWIIDGLITATHEDTAALILRHTAEHTRTLDLDTLTPSVRARLTWHLAWNTEQETAYRLYHEFRGTHGPEATLRYRAVYPADMKLLSDLTSKARDQLDLALAQARQHTGPGPLTIRQALHTGYHLTIHQLALINGHTPCLLLQATLHHHHHHQRAAIAILPSYRSRGRLDTDHAYLTRTHQFMTRTMPHTFTMQPDIHGAALHLGYRQPLAVIRFTEPQQPSDQ